MSDSLNTLCSEAGRSLSTIQGHGLRLRFGPFGMTASRRRGVLHPCPFGARRAAFGRFAHQKDMVSQEPSPSGAVKAREAPAQRLGLDGEHGDGTGPSLPNWCGSAVAAFAERRGAPGRGRRLRTTLGGIGRPLAAKRSRARRARAPPSIASLRPRRRKGADRICARFAVHEGRPRNRGAEVGAGVAVGSERFAPIPASAVRKGGVT